MKKIGQKYGLLTIRGLARPDDHGNRRVCCECDCGVWVIVSECNLYPTGKTQSCGCVRKKQKQQHLTAVQRRNRIARSAQALTVPPRPDTETRSERCARYAALRKKGFSIAAIALAEGVTRQYVSAESRRAAR